MTLVKRMLAAPNIRKRASIRGKRSSLANFAYCTPMREAMPAAIASGVVNFIDSATNPHPPAP
ncbi:MAG: hypothetical protein OXQ99_07205, partial [Chloroflexota bacterium]|nr:hypothetical protein [Chloroflexota bacterium]